VRLSEIVQWQQEHIAALEKDVAKLRVDGRRGGASYFRFVTSTGVEPNNNLAEQGIRFVTSDRHMIQGTRSEPGRQSSEGIWTVLATCAAQGRSPYERLGDVVEAHFNALSIPSRLAMPR